MVRNVEDFHVLNGFGKKAGKSVAARARGELLSLCLERIGISLKFLHRVTRGAFHSESSGALKDVLSEVAAWTEHDKWCASGSEERSKCCKEFHGVFRCLGCQVNWRLNRLVRQVLARFDESAHRQCGAC